MKKIIFLFLITAAIACTNATKQEIKSNNNLVLAESIQSILPLEADTVWDGSDLTNAKCKFDREKVFSSIISGVLSGKLQAYANYPDQMLSIDNVQHILVQWDSTNMAEDVHHPGFMVSAPIKKDIGAFNVPQIKFHEKIEMDTIAGTISKKVSYITLYTYMTDAKGDLNGIMKVFDVKLND